MSVIELDAHRKTAMQNLVAVALRLERDENVDHWELADSTLTAAGYRGNRLARAVFDLTHGKHRMPLTIDTPEANAALEGQSK